MIDLGGFFDLVSQLLALFGYESGSLLGWLFGLFGI